ncbi:MAG: hypothetical protein QME66_07420 [Candidatus Eisenbacteria bacterium]|nr:hypothetical protein [Candidatus Eisenbacteria bacterium]
MRDHTKSGGITGDVGAIIGPIWIMGWLFTVGFLGPSFWKAVLALVLWPYFLGVSLR